MQGDPEEPGRADHHAKFEAFRADLEAAERRVASEIDPGGRALAVAIGVFVLLAAFLLPHTGRVSGFDVAVAGPGTEEAGVTLPLRLFAWLTLIFPVGFSLMALLLRRWVVAWVALAGSAVTSVVGLLAVWSRQTVAADQPGPGVGLILAWFAVIFLAFHWARLVWSRTALQLAAEQQRRTNMAREPRTLLDDPDRKRRPEQ